MTDGGLTFTTTVGVIAGVHDGTANCRTNALVSCFTCLTDLNGVVVDIADLSDNCLAVKRNVANLTRGKAYLCHAVCFLGEELCHGTCGTDELSALAGANFDIVDESTNRNVSQGESVTGLNVGICAGVDLVAYLKTFGSYDVALYALIVLKQSDVSGSVGVVLDCNDLCGRRAESLEVDDSELDLVSAASVANGDTSVAVTARVLLLDNYKALLGSVLRDDVLVYRNRHVSSRGCRRFIL